jgi:hypothetical protein
VHRDYFGCVVHENVTVCEVLEVAVTV